MKNVKDHTIGGYDQLSLRDLLDARDQYHLHLMRHKNVVATAVGRYRIRVSDSWPGRTGSGQKHGTGARTLANSEVRPYSWPAILAFVKTWEDQQSLDPSDVVPKTLYLSDGRRVPVCVIEAPKEDLNERRPITVVFPENNIGGGAPVVVETQGRRYLATIACLVSDGHTVYAMTNRHVAGEAGEVVYSSIGGALERIGVSSERHLTRMPFASYYAGWPGRDTYVNLDVGLIRIDDLDRWTAKLRGTGQMGKMVDLSSSNISLSLIGQKVRGCGAASGEMQGELAALFYRYKTNSGFEYVADVMIGPRPARSATTLKTRFATLPGDSGTLWLSDPPTASHSDSGENETKPEYLPLAMQWGRNMLYSSSDARPQGYALATFLSGVCAALQVDPVRNWNLDQPDTWSAVGHFSIASRAQNALSKRCPKLVELMANNADLISPNDEAIEQGDFVGMGDQAFVPLADVPDFFWKAKIAHQGYGRPAEGPNHFADMDQPNEAGKTLLDLCEDQTYIDPDRWNDFYSSVVDLSTGKKISMNHRGLLPFRVWQLFDAMVRFADAGQGREFVCAAGALTHYIGDACQPLHISYLHDGDPERSVKHKIKTGPRAGQVEERTYGAGVHGAYEDTMVYLNRLDVLAALDKTPKSQKSEMISTGREAAQLTVNMMRSTFEELPPMEIVEEFATFDGKPQERAERLWKVFGTRTKKSMQSGAHLLAVLWESAWSVGGGESTVKSTKTFTKAQAMAICADASFVPSVTIDKIGALLKK